jgi:uncharacterized Zn finger protein (UPF0148 family)
MSENKKTLSLLERMKQKAVGQKSYGGEYIEEPAKVNARTCPNCGAGRAEQDGLTHCAYCSFEFLSVKLTDGINIKKEDNSQTI